MIPRPAPTRLPGRVPAEGLVDGTEPGGTADQERPAGEQKAEPEPAAAGQPEGGQGPAADGGEEPLLGPHVYRHRIPAGGLAGLVEVANPLVRDGVVGDARSRG